MRLTREQMEKEIERGRSIGLPDGRIVTRVEDLPNPEDLADSPEAKAKADEDLAAEIARLEARRARLNADTMVRKPDETLKPDAKPSKPAPKAE